MANFATNSLRNIFWGTGTRVDFDAETMKVMFVDAADDVPVVTDDFIDDILAAGRVPAIASCPVLGTKTIGTSAVGAIDSADPVFTALTGDQVEWLIMFKDTGTEATSDLMLAYDTFSSGMPLTPNGGNVTITVAAAGWASIA